MITSNVEIELYDNKGETIGTLSTRIDYNPIKDTDGRPIHEFFYSCPLLDGQYNTKAMLIDDLVHNLCYKIYRADSANVFSTVRSDEKFYSVVRDYNSERDE